MKILASSDLHINDWIQYSTFDEYMRPSRLTDYIKLANVMKDLAVKEDVDCIILAGDISEKSTQQPSVHDVIGDFLRILAKSNKPVYVIHGQHDSATKTEQKDYAHSILTEICKDMEDIGVYYYGKTELVEINGYSMLFHPWVADHSLDELPNADIFVGHGVVKGCTNLDNYVFMNGFNKNELFEKYSLSIIGDIHKKQLHKNGGSVILQPGCPLQNSFKDDPDCGLWVVDYDKLTGNIDSSFNNIHDLSPNTFHQFIYDSESTELIHSRPKIKANKEIKENKVEIKRDNKVIYDSCLKIIDSQELLHKDLTKEYLEEVFKEVSLSSDKYIANTVIKKIYVKNFLSIDELKLDFDNFPKSCVIVGNNGSGKSTIPEAIYWGLTGNTTKSTQVSELLNKYTEAEECFIKLELNINGKDLIIKRSRKTNSSSLSLQTEDGEHKRTSIRETQALIYSMLGLKDWQILMFSYFSAEKTSIFSNLGESDKNDLIGQIVGLDFIEAMRNYSKEKRVNINKELTKCETLLTEKQNNAAKLKLKLTSLMESEGENKPKIEAKIVKIKNEKNIQEEELVNVINKLNGLKNSNKSNDSKDKYFEAQSKYESVKNKSVLLKTQIKDLKSRIVKATQGKCPECNQDLHDESMLKSLKIELIEKVNIDKDLPNLDELEIKLRTLSENVKKESSYNKELEELSRKEYKIKSNIMDLDSKINSLNLELEKESNKTLIDHITLNIKELINEEENLIKDSLILDKDLKCWKYLESNLFKKNGDLIKELNKQGSVLIQDCINEVLYDTTFNVKIDKDLNVTGKFYNKTNISYNLMSSGQKRIVDIVLMVSLNNLMSKIYNLENGILGLCIYDEILSFLDTEYMHIAKQIVDQSITNKILIITHDHGLMNMYDSKIKVDMGNTGSVYNKSWE